MKVFKSFDKKVNICQKTAVALGSFDAIHKGHIEVIESAIKYAKKKGLKAAVQLFDMPTKNTENINTLKMRLKIVESLGVDIVFVEQFNDEFKKINYKDFVKDFLSQRYCASAVFSGENYRFGNNAQGDTEKLLEECSKYGINAFKVETVKDGEIISSTRIRNLLKKGDVKKAAELMTRPYCIEGTVVKGSKIGRNIDIPTANIDIPQGRAMIGDGVYLTQVIIEGKSFYGTTNVGAKPTVGNQNRNIETHIIDFSGDLYEKNIEIKFIKRIRDIKKFESLELLKKQIEEDKKIIK